MRIHPRPVRLRIAALLAWGGALLALAGCAKGVEKEFVANQVPVVRLTHAPVTPTSREEYAYRMNWVGYDPDGRVDHFLYAIDPANLDAPDSTWQATDLNEQLFYFRASQPDEPVNQSRPTASDFHTFAIRAVDELGGQSETVYRTFFSFTAAPIITIQAPRPSIDEPILTPATRIRWAGIDSDGLTGKPVKYRFRLFSRRNPDRPDIPDFIRFATDTATTDDFRKLYAPTFGPNPNCPTCTDWDSSPGDTTEAQFTSLIPQQGYLFVVTGFDDAGAYDPVWLRTKNMLQFVVGYAGVKGPTLCMFNEYFSYCYQVPGYFINPERIVKIEVPAGTPGSQENAVTINWFATPPPGAEMKRYRWVVDLDDLTDETERTGPDDINHWSPWSLNTTSATIGPFYNNNEIHTFYIEAEDNNNLKSLGIVEFTVVKSTFENDILFVDDTRLSPDRFTGNNLIPPVGTWPTAAELDTFFYARGGNPWKRYPSGSISPIGIFSGYNYDTLGTRQITTGIVPLSTLGRYKTVVWYVDAGGANLTDLPTDSRLPTTSLRFMSSPGQSNTLAIYARQGGRVWLFGGGGAYATIGPWNRGSASIFTDPETNPNEGEIVPGRFLYEFVHWRNGLLAGTHQSSRMVREQFNGTGPSRGWAGAPNYDALYAAMDAAESPPQDGSFASSAAFMQRRSAQDPGDAPPPLRSASADWYQTNTFAEVINVSTFIREDINGTAAGGTISTLDTIFVGVGGSVGVNRPIMTYYHGLDFPAVGEPYAKIVFSGFPLWYYRRAQQIVLADFVLQDIFGHSRDPLPRGPHLTAARATPAGMQRMAQPLSAPGRGARTNRE